MIASKKIWLLAATVIGLVSGCGGDGDGGITATPGVLGGTAAVGSPIVGGSIAVTCAGGSVLPATTTSATGAWQVTLLGQSLPCAIQVSGGTVNNVANTNAYHSIATALGNVNVSPITDLIVANLAGAAVPGTWFSGLNNAAFSAVTVNAVTAALAQVRSALALSALNGIDPLTIVFTAAGGNTMDDILTALKAAITNTGGSLAALRAAAAGATFTAPPGFSTALAAGYAGTKSGGGSGGGGGGGGGGASSLVVTSIGGSARNGTYAPDASKQAAGADTDVLGQTLDGKFEYDIVYMPNGTIKTASIWFFGASNSITFFGCNNTNLSCGNLVGYEPVTKQILFNAAALSQVSDPFAVGGMVLVANGERVQVSGHIAVP